MAVHPQTFAQYGIESETFLKSMPAYKQGFKVVQDLKLGDRFEGASPAAESWGYHNEPYRFAFMQGYLDAVRRFYPNGVIVNEDGYMMKQDRKA